MKAFAQPLTQQRLQSIVDMDSAFQRSQEDADCESTLGKCFCIDGSTRHENDWEKICRRYQCASAAALAETN